MSFLQPNAKDPNLYDWTLQLQAPAPDTANWPARGSVNAAIRLTSETGDVIITDDFMLTTGDAAP
jgi:hypothetical protein